MFPTINVYPINTLNFDSTQAQDLQFNSSNIDNDISSFEAYIYRKSDNALIYDSTQSSAFTQDDNYVYHFTLPANKLVNGVDYYWNVKAWNCDTTPKVGGLSNDAYFSCIAFPVVTVQTAGTYMKPVLTVNWTFSGNQINYRVVVKCGSNTVVDSGLVNGSDSSYQFGISQVQLQTSKTYTIQVTATSDKGLVGTGSSTINTNFTTNPPPKPSLVLTADNLVGKVTCTITNPAPGGGQETTISNQIYRLNDVGEWICIASNLSPNATFTDNNVNININQQYYVLTAALNGITTASDIAVVNVSVPKITGAQIYPIDNVNSGYVINYDLECTETFGRLKVLNEFNGRERPVPDVGDNINRKFNISFTSMLFSDLNILRQLAMSTSILFYRDKKGRGLYCTIDQDSLQIQNKRPRLFSISFNITEVDYNQG